MCTILAGQQVMKRQQSAASSAADVLGSREVAEHSGVTVCDDPTATVRRRVRPSPVRCMLTPELASCVRWVWDFLEEPLDFLRLSLVSKPVNTAIKTDAHLRFSLLTNMRKLALQAFEQMESDNAPMLSLDVQAFMRLISHVLPAPARIERAALWQLQHYIEADIHMGLYGAVWACISARRPEEEPPGLETELGAYSTRMLVSDWKVARRLQRWSLTPKEWKRWKVPIERTDELVIIRGAMEGCLRRLVRRMGVLDYEPKLLDAIFDEVASIMVRVFAMIRGEEEGDGAMGDITPSAHVAGEEEVGLAVRWQQAVHAEDGGRGTHDESSGVAGDGQTQAREEGRDVSHSIILKLLSGMRRNGEFISNPHSLVPPDELLLTKSIRAVRVLDDAIKLVKSPWGEWLDEEEIADIDAVMERPDMLELLQGIVESELRGWFEAGAYILKHIKATCGSYSAETSSVVQTAVYMARADSFNYAPEAAWEGLLSPWEDGLFDMAAQYGLPDSLEIDWISDRLCSIIHRLVHAITTVVVCLGGRNHGGDVGGASDVDEDGESDDDDHAEDVADETDVEDETT